MKMKAIAILLTGLLICTAALARDRSPPATQDGLQLVPDTRLGLVYMDPEADLAVYDKLLLIEAQVAFKKNWQRDTNQARPFHVTASDMTRIKADVAGLFREIFTRELESAGFMLVTEQAPDTLIIRPAIVDLNISSPDTPRGGTTRNITESAGDMTLYLELRDSITGDLLVKALDFQFDRSNITPFMMDRTRNTNAAKRLLTNWAQVLVEGLQETGVKASNTP
ncbi:MAG: DUF3313 domain-containing protein [Xanthomonadales bacterium]|jgi:hypothetical protein|nr:DUF3313 domain-containing protein [Xanthomonadales bacterium]